MSWKNLLKWVAICIECWFVIIGILTTVVLFHEVYHLIDLEGNPIGICFGKCYVGSEYGEYAPSGIIWEKFPEEYLLNPKENEIQAWIFGIVIMTILCGIGILETFIERKN